MEYEHLRVERDGHVAWVQFHRPEVANALNRDHLREIEHAALSFRDDFQTRAVVFHGAGKHFSSGADLNEARLGAEGGLLESRRRIRHGERAIRAIYGMDQITIAAMTGAAMGGGACLAAAADFRIGADSCFVQLPEIDIGVNLMWTSLPLFVHLLGPARAKRLIAGGERFHAATLSEWGFLDAQAADREVPETAREWAAFYAAKPPVAAQMIKRSVNAVTAALDQAIMHADFDQALLAQSTEDAIRARAAYRNGESALFEGR